MGLGSILKSVFVNPFTFVFSKFRKLDPHKAAAAIQKIIDLADEGLAAAQMIAMLTPNPADDLIIAALKTLNLTAEQVVQASDRFFSNGARLELAGEVLRQRLIKAIKAGGQVKIGNEIISSVEQILALPADTLTSAAKIAYSAMKSAEK